MNDRIIMLMQQLLDTGLWGKDIKEIQERLICAQLNQLFDEKPLKRNPFKQGASK